MQTKIYNMEQRSVEWFNIRIGKMTGSKVKNIINLITMGLKKDILTPVCKLIAEIQTGIPIDTGMKTDAMKWGIELEKDVIDILKNDFYQPVGFAVNEKFKYFGISPDMIFFENGVPYKGTEIKCPNSETHIKYIIEKKVPTEHMAQFLMYFVIFPDIKEMQFVSYDPRNLKSDFFYIKKTRKEMQEKIDKMEKSLLLFEKKIVEFMKGFDKK